MRWLLLPMLGVVAALPSVLAEGFTPVPIKNSWPPPAPAPLEAKPWKKDKLLYTPADVSRYAAIDAKQLSYVLAAEDLYNIRYLSLANIPSEMRDVWADSDSFLINSLSRDQDMHLPAILGPDNILLRINLKDYDIHAEDYDKLADVDPYFHQTNTETLVKVTEVRQDVAVPVPSTSLDAGPPHGLAVAILTSREGARTIKKVWTGGLDHGGHYWPAGHEFLVPLAADQEEKIRQEIAVNLVKLSRVRPDVSHKEVLVKQTQTKVGKPKNKITAAAWLDPEAMGVLTQLTNSRTPLLRGDWFLATASLPPFYYDILRLQTLDDAKELAAFDKRLQKITDRKATVVLSGSGGLARKVARNNRLMERINTGFGAFWQTFDFLDSVGPKNMIHNFLTNKRDGGEIIFNLPNGLQGYFLVNGQDARVDEVPIAIAVDSLAQDVRVRNGRSCIWCHTRGIQDFVSDFKLQIKPEGLTDLGLQVKNVHEAVDLARDIRRVFESPDWKGIVRADQVRYENAVQACTRGRKSVSNAALFLQLYDDYEEVPMDASRLVYEAGISDLDVQAAIRTRVNGVNNGVLLRRLLQPPLLIRRDQWEEAYETFMLGVIGWEAARKTLPVKDP